MGGYSDFLFARPSVWFGVASCVDFGATLVEFNRSPTPESADHRALEADWKAVGADMRESMALAAPSSK